LSVFGEKCRKIEYPVQGRWPGHGTKGWESSVASKILGTVVEVSNEGDLITDIGTDKLAEVKRSAETKIVVDEEHETFGIFDSDHNQPAMTLIAIAEEQKPLRLHLVSDSAAMMLGVRKGASVQILW
jgi:S-adenosylmethionine hydrolase